MYITSEQFLFETKDSGISIIAGKGGMWKLITGSQVTDIDDITMTSLERKLVFTAGVGIGGEESLLKLITYTFSHAASGFVIETGQFIKSIPDSVKEFCNQNDLPLYDLPYRVPVGNITYRIENLLEEKKQRLEIASGILKKSIAGKSISIFPGQISYYGYDSDREYFPIVIEKDNDRTEKIKVFEALNRAKITTGLWDEKDNRIVFIFEYDDRKKEKINTLKDYLDKEDGGTYSIGVGPDISESDEIKGCILEAVEALDMIRQCHKIDEVRFFENTGVYRLFYEYGNNNELKDISNETLMPLIEYDTKNKSRLTELVEDYLENRCNLSVIAKEYDLPRNTIRYQIEKAGEILNMDFKDVNQRFTLRLAFKIRKYLDRV